MEKFSFINLNDFTWQLNIAFAGGIFAVFSLIYDDHYIFYGLFTFAFGTVGHIFYKFFEWLFGEKGVKHPFYWVAHFCNAVLATAWIATIVWFY